MGTQIENVIVIGATGLIGREIVKRLSEAPQRYSVIGVSRNDDSGFDLEDPASIRAFFDGVSPFTHVVVAAGDARFGVIDALDRAQIEVGLHSKLMGQVEVTLAALRRLPSGGSITLTSGALAHTPIPGSAAVALVNGAIDSFVRAAAIDIPADRRINVVSPGWIKETMIAMGLDPSTGTSARDVSALYQHAIESARHGSVISAGPATAHECAPRDLHAVGG